MAPVSSAAVWLRERALRTPERLALLADGERFNFAALHHEASRRAAGLIERGVRPGELVALWLPPGAEGVFRLWGTWLAGARALPMNTRLVASEASRLLERVRPHHRIDIDTRIDAATGLAGKDAPLLVDSSDEIALVLFTSGTGGLPKAACLRHANLRASAEASARHLGVREDDRWLACLPLFHVGGLMILVRSVLDGAGVVLQPGFDAARVAGALDREGVTLVSLVPTTLKRLLDHRAGRSAPASLRGVLLGGAAAPESLLRRARELGYPVRATYGLTEAASQVATAGPRDLGPGLVGHPLPGTELKVIDEAGAPLGFEQEGEVCVRGPSVFAGYLEGPERGREDARRNARVLQDGWLHTGDRGCLDPQGRLWMRGRRGDLIVSGGENVHPGEVEAALLDHPAVDEVAVAGLSDEDLGQRVAAWVVPRRLDAPPDPDDLLAFARASLAGYKLPRDIRFVPALPRNAMGKLLRRELSGLKTTPPA